MEWARGQTVQAVARDEQWFITAVALALEQAAVLVDSRLAHEVFLVAQVEVLEVVLHTARDSNMRLQHAARGARRATLQQLPRKRRFGASDPNPESMVQTLAST